MGLENEKDGELSVGKERDIEKDSIKEVERGRSWLKGKRVSHTDWGS